MKKLRLNKIVFHQLRMPNTIYAKKLLFFGMSHPFSCSVYLHQYLVIFLRIYEQCIVVSEFLQYKYTLLKLLQFNKNTFYSSYIYKTYSQMSLCHWDLVQMSCSHTPPLCTWYH